MKHEIQQKLKAPWGGLSWTQRNEAVKKSLAADQRLARLLQTAVSTETAAPRRRAS